LILSINAYADNLFFYFLNILDLLKEWRLGGDQILSRAKLETFEKCSILFKFKEGENFNHRNTLSILRIKI